MTIDTEGNAQRLRAISRLLSTIREAYSKPLSQFLGVLRSIPITDSASKAGKQKSNEWQRLKEIVITNFKTIKKATIPLGELTIIVGPNSSGKTSVLQAAHWAARAASYIAPKDTREVIAFDRLDYIPSSRPLATGYLSELGSGKAQPHTAVSFVHESTSSGGILGATVKIWAARNRGAIAAHIEGGSYVTPFKQRTRPITSYIPGLAGLSERETILAQPLLRRNAASGDAGGVLRNVLYNLASRQADEAVDAPTARLKRLNDLLADIHPGFSVNVSFDEREDVHINATYQRDGVDSKPKPLEDLATGILQVLQIFAYLILFRPKLLLVDEPDAHLHADKQERLVETLEAAAGEFGTQVILTTHSQHVVRAASSATQLVWMHSGQVVSDDIKSIRARMGWGGLDKSVIFFVEDEDDEAIRSILRQWPSVARHVSICRCFGVDNLPRRPMLEGLAREGEILLVSVLHRDRDFMTDEEAKNWAGQFSQAFAWVTEQVDVESYFCQPAYLAALFRVSEQLASEWVHEAAASVSGAKKAFKEKRQVIIRLLYPEGGSPNSEDLWQSLGEQGPKTVLGKALLKALKPIVKKHGHQDRLLDRFAIPSTYEVAPDLLRVIETAVKQATTPPAKANARATNWKGAVGLGE